MAETFRRGKIEDIIGRLAVRKAILKNQLKQPEFKGSTLYIQGQLSAVDLIVRELAVEFDATNLPCLNNVEEYPEPKGDELDASRF